jgi:hypothetical protein
MANQWENNKGVKFVGQTAAVPAPDFKASTIVDYDELKTVEIVFNQSAAPTQGNNTNPQTVNISAQVKSAVENPLTRWEYDVQFMNGHGDVAVTLQNPSSAPHSGSTQAVFPAGVKTGQVGIIKATSGGVSGLLKITVL